MARKASLRVRRGNRKIEISMNDIINVGSSIISNAEKKIYDFSDEYNERFVVAWLLNEPKDNMHNVLIYVYYSGKTWEKRPQFFLTVGSGLYIKKLGELFDYAGQYSSTFFLRKNMKYLYPKLEELVDNISVIFSKYTLSLKLARSIKINSENLETIITTAMHSAFLKVKTRMRRDIIMEYYNIGGKTLYHIIEASLRVAKNEYGGFYNFMIKCLAMEILRTVLREKGYNII